MIVEVVGGYFANKWGQDGCIDTSLTVTAAQEFFLATICVSPEVVLCCAVERS